MKGKGQIGLGCGAEEPIVREVEYPTAGIKAPFDRNAGGTDPENESLGCRVGDAPTRYDAAGGDGVSPFNRF
jgi:hypothetical protein